MNMRLIPGLAFALAIIGTAAAPAAALTFFSVGKIVGAGPGDPGLAAFEKSLVTFGAPSAAGVIETHTGTVGLFTGTSRPAAAPFGDTGVYEAIGIGGASTFDLRGYFASQNGTVRSISVYVGSVDRYNQIDILDNNLAVIDTIYGSDLPASNGDRGASISNRRVYINFAPGENVGGLAFRSSGIAFEFDTIGASTAIFAVPEGATPEVLPPASNVPEPSTWALMLAGFALTGVGMRKRSAAA